MMYVIVLVPIAEITNLLSPYCLAPPPTSKLMSFFLEPRRQAGCAWCSRQRPVGWVLGAAARVRNALGPTRRAPAGAGTSRRRQRSSLRAQRPRAAALSRLLGGPRAPALRSSCVLHSWTHLLTCPSSVYLHYSMSSVLSLPLLWAGEFFQEKPVNTEKSQSTLGQFLARS